MSEKSLFSNQTNQPHSTSHCPTILSLDGASPASSRSDATTNIPLRKPSRRHHRQFLPQLTQILRTIRHHHNGLLHSRPRNLRRLVFQNARVDLPGASDTEKRSRGLRGGLFLVQGEIRELLGRPNCSARTMSTRH